MAERPCWNCTAKHFNADDCRGDFGGNATCPHIPTETEMLRQELTTAQTERDDLQEELTDCHQTLDTAGVPKGEQQDSEAPLVHYNVLGRIKALAKQRDDLRAKLLLIETAAEVCGEPALEAVRLAGQYRRERDALAAQNATMRPLLEQADSWLPDNEAMYDFHKEVEQALSTSPTHAEQVYSAAVDVCEAAKASCRYNYTPDCDQECIDDMERLKQALAHYASLAHERADG